MAGKGMVGFKARYQEWRSNFSGSYINLSSYSVSAIYKTEIPLCPQ